MRFLQIAALLLLVSSTLFADQISIIVLDATVKDKRISGASVLLQQTGEQTVSAATDENGEAVFNSSKAENAETLLIIKKEGFSDLVVKCPCDGLTYALSPAMKNLDGLRIVLTWGENTIDLDSHLIYADSHIFFGSKVGVRAWLDVDDTDSFGPETITIEKKIYGTNYTYAVHNFSYRVTNNTTLADSGAKVFVYVGRSLMKTYSVPSDERGTIWTVFRINNDGNFEDINRITFVPVSDEAEDIDELARELGREIKQALKSQQTPTASGAVVNTQWAQSLNKQGETAYHAGLLEKSIEYYSAAISFDETYAQAYSNLGLSYQKLDLAAECIWANRKAISYASGIDAKTIRASSFYNIARLYEQNGEFAEALRYYKLAKSEKQNTVYDTAIKRVNSKNK